MSKKSGLTREDWLYISVLIAADVRKDRAHGLDSVADAHRLVWERIQPLLTVGGDHE